MNRLAILLCLAVGVLAASTQFSGDSWQRRSASDKADTLWRSVTASSRAGDWPSTISLAGLFTESMATSFDTYADDMPKQGLTGFFSRRKLIHSVGAIARVRWVSLDSTYSGVFSGHENAFIRISLAKKPDDSASKPWTVGAAFKFLRSGRPSGNFFAMYALDGQASYNPFRHDLSSNVPDLHNPEVALKALRAKFATASDFPVMLGLSDVAKFDEEGNEYSNEQFPFRLQFTPPANIRSMLSDSSSGRSIADVLSSASGLHSGVRLYDVWAAAEPGVYSPGSKMKRVGYVELTSSFVKSEFADETLFFQHQRKEDDFHKRPQWIMAAKKEMKAQQDAEFHYPDMPNV